MNPQLSASFRTRLQLPFRPPIPMPNCSLSVDESSGCFLASAGGGNRSDSESGECTFATVGVVWTAVSPVVAFALAAGFMLAGTLAITRVRD